MSLFAPAPPPPTKLGRYRLLSPNAGIRVSPLQLGAMSIGDKWDSVGMGSMTKEQSFKLLNAYFDAGGNFIDTANNYQDETSEQFIGEWVEQRGIRNQLVISTKYTAFYKRADPNVTIGVNYLGNNVKSMSISLDDSLKKLRTTYVDIFYIHWWDYDTSIPELMNGLHNLVAQGKVLYLGASDTPAWVVAKANQYARDHGKTPFSIYQGAWNVMDRTFERDILPMARDEGLALAPWNVLGGGKLRSDEEEKRRLESGEKGRTFASPEWLRSETEVKVSRALEKVAKEVGAKQITAVAIAYLLQKAPFVFPIVGGRKVEHLLGNLEALDITLSKEQIAYLESIVPVDPGFPNFLIGDGTSYGPMFTSAAYVEQRPLREPVKPSP